VHPLEDGWRERVGLHQLHPLLVHAALFGGSYGEQALAAAHQYL
jgi:fructosamine-3-kinase